jgi:hypothetical protein
MITWDYSVFRDDDDTYVIREVFYDQDGAIVGCTANAVEPFGRTLDELAQTLEEFQAALALPILTLNDIPKLSAQPEQKRQVETVSHEHLRSQLGLGQSVERTNKTSNKKAS